MRQTVQPRRWNRLEKDAPRGNLRPVSTLADVDPKDLRPLLHEQIDRLTEEEMDAVRRALLKLEAKRRLDALRTEVEEDWQSGRITEAKIEQAIGDHRAQHPYR